LTFGRIPRGKAKAPEAVCPQKMPSRDEMREALERTRKRFGATAQCLGALQSPEARQRVVKHPALGKLNALQWLRFIEIHTKHHLKIIKDVRRTLAK
jgi:hypothetical protein